MVSLRLREQQQIFTYSSLVVSACGLGLRISDLPHSLIYTIAKRYFFKYSLASFSRIISIPILFLFSLGLIGYFLLHGLGAFKQYKYKAFLPLAINLFTVIMLLFMHYAVVLPDFYANLKEREAVVAQIISGQLTPKESQRIDVSLIPDHPYKIYNLTLSSKYTHLSKGRGADGKINIPGEINILVDEKTSQLEMVVFFNGFNDRGGELSAYTAFVYKVKTNSISERDLFGVSNRYDMWLLESKQIKDNWFWVDLLDKYNM